MQDKFETTIVGIQNNFGDKALANFITAITPQFIQDGVGILSDNVKSWRFQNQIKILMKSKELCEKHNIPLKMINLKFLVPLIENSSLEEDEEMQNRWAALLTNAIKDSQNANPSFINILKQLTPQEAAVLDELHAVASKIADYHVRNVLQFSKATINQKFLFSAEMMDLIIEDLFRFNLCRRLSCGGGYDHDDHRYEHALPSHLLQGSSNLTADNFFELTLLGYTFIEACKLK